MWLKEKLSFFFTARSPVVNHLVDTLQGLSTVRSFQSEEVLKNEFDEHQDFNSSAQFLNVSSNRTLLCYCDLLCALNTLITIFMFITLNNKTSLGKVAIIIIRSIMLSTSVKILILYLAEVESSMISVERI